MNAIRTPIRDNLISFAEGVIEDAWDEVYGACPDCRGALTSWCDAHTELQARVDELGPVLLRLYPTRTDDEARMVAAGLPALALAVKTEGSRAA